MQLCPDSVPACFFFVVHHFLLMIKYQKGYFFGDFKAMFTKFHGKELSYNNLLDVDAAVNLMNEFNGEEPTFAILKHNNACGVAQRATLREAYIDALAADPVSAFGGVLISNCEIDLATAHEINTLFCEVVIAPSFSAEAETILKGKKNSSPDEVIVMIASTCRYAATCAR